MKVYDVRLFTWEEFVKWNKVASGIMRPIVVSRRMLMATPSMTSHPAQNKRNCYVVLLPRNLLDFNQAPWFLDSGKDNLLW